MQLLTIGESVGLQLSTVGESLVFTACLESVAAAPGAGGLHVAVLLLVGAAVAGLAGGPEHGQVAHVL